MNEFMIHTRNVAIGYRKKKSDSVIATGIDINVASGQLVALVGANGIGKSTLLRTLTGIQPPLQGQIFLGCTNIEHMTARDIAKELSVVLTEKLPPSNLTVYELVALGRQPYTNWMGRLSEIDKTAIHNAVELTDIGHLLSKKHYELSDGQMQKVLIARALAQDTPLIVLDEPTTHLDLNHKANLLQLLKKLTRETAKAILFSTHDIDLAIQLCDELIVMTAQKIVQDIPMRLIENGTFDTMFPNTTIKFDQSSHTFIIADF
ncbi:MAG: ABC transporter ATP-binding protein [Flavobacterium sp.]|nr:ABC transporter ATP-binding protein [Flavobacterium sp.]